MSLEPTIALVNGFSNGTVRDWYIVTVTWWSATGPAAAELFSESSTLISAASGRATAKSVSKAATVTNTRRRKGAGLARPAEPLQFPVHLGVINPFLCGKQNLNIRSPLEAVD